MTPRPQRLSKAQRLRTPRDFKRVYQSEHWGGSDCHTFNVSALQQGRPVLGVTVSKRVSKSAVVRNRIRREIKEYFRLHQKQLAPLELIITARPGSAGKSRQQRRQSLQVLWQKLLKWQRWYQQVQTTNH